MNLTVKNTKTKKGLVQGVKLIKSSDHFIGMTY